MSSIASWDAATWLWAGLGVMIIVLGIAQLLRTWRGEPARASDWDLRYGRGADLDASPSIWWERIGDISFIAIGLLLLLELRPGRQGAPPLGLGVFIVAAGLWLLLFDPAFAAWRRRRHEARLAARLGRGTDAYFEELRALEAYPPAPPAAASRGQLALGALYLVLGGAMIAVNLDR